MQVELSHNPEFQDDSSIVIILQQRPQRHIIGEMLQFHSSTICSKGMETRFDQSSRTCSVIFKLIPKLLLAVDDLQDLCDKLMFWRTDLPSPMSLLSELKYWKSSHSKDLTVTNLIECLRCCDRDVFPNIYELLCLGCVAPVSRCEAERSSSGLRRIKTHLRNSMTVKRLACTSQCRNRT